MSIEGWPGPALRPVTENTVGIDVASLWTAHGHELIRLATLLVGPSDAPDVVAVALGRVSASLARAERPVEDHRAYLVRAVTNRAIDQSRSRRRRQERELKAAAADPVASPVPVAAQLDVRRAVAGLSVRQRAVVYLTYWEDLDAPRIGAVLGIDDATVRRHLARARIHLRKALQ